MFDFCIMCVRKRKGCSARTPALVLWGLPLGSRRFGLFGRGKEVSSLIRVLNKLFWLLLNKICQSGWNEIVYTAVACCIEIVMPLLGEQQRILWKFSWQQWFDSNDPFKLRVQFAFSFFTLTLLYSFEYPKDFRQPTALFYAFLYAYANKLCWTTRLWLGVYKSLTLSVSNIK